MNLPRAALAAVLLATSLPLRAAEDEELAEVVVTARLVSETAARVPLTIDVAAASQLGAGGVQRLDGLASEFPGLAFESMWGGSNAAPILRGLSQPSTAGDNVGVFVDDVYQAGRSAMDVEMLDLERVEVVRGPQNTLFGRSSFAGAIRYVAARPTADPLLQLRADLGSDRLGGLQLIGSSRILDSDWLGRVAVGYRRGNGARRSIEGESLGDFDRRSLALSIAREAAATNERELTLSLRHNEGRSGHPASTTLDADDYNCGAATAATGYWSYYCGPVPLDTGFSLSRGLRDSHSRSTQAALHFTHPLGAIILRSISSYYESRSVSYRDIDGTSGGLWSGVCTVGINCQPVPSGTPVTRYQWPNVVSRATEESRDWAQELRISGGHENALSWVLGVAGAWTRVDRYAAIGADRGDLLDNERLTSIVATNPVMVGPSSRLNGALVADSRFGQVPQSQTGEISRSLAAFGVLDHPLASRSRARLELRAQREVQRVVPVLANFVPSIDPPPPTIRFSQVTPRLSIDYSPSGHWYGYASLARGTRSGGVNTVPGLDRGEQGFDPEYNWTTELGLRHAGPGFVQLAQVTAYKIQWRDAQIVGLATTPGINALITTNTAGIRSRGIELQLRLRASPVLSGRFAWSLVDARFRAGSDDPGSRAFCGLTAQPPASDFCAFGPPRSGNGSIALVVYLDGNRTARAPRHSWNASLVAGPVQMGSGWSAGGQVTLAHQGNVFDRPINGPYFGERSLLGARLWVHKGAWEIALWGSNLTGEHYVGTSANRGVLYYPSLPRPLDLLHGEGRRWGLSIGWNLPD